MQHPSPEGEDGRDGRWIPGGGAIASAMGWGGDEPADGGGEGGGGAVEKPTAQELDEQDEQADLKRLRGASYDALPDFELRGAYSCKVVRVYDGDTFHVAIRPQLDKDGRTYRVCCRLAGVDTPEIPRAHADAFEAARAYAARDRLVELATGLVVTEEEKRRASDESGTPMPSLTDLQLQRKLDAQNATVLPRGLHLHGLEKYGRHLASLTAVDSGEDVGTVLLREGLAVPYGESPTKEGEQAPDRTPVH